MPRMARVKAEEAVYHVMVRSISEVPLFADSADKKKYIFFIIRCLKSYEFRVLAYCLMDNHAHFIIDGSGADISRIMHNINFCYAMYYNKVHKRHGHLFQDRFKSKIVGDDRYLLTLSAYIHNNPTDLPGYGDHPERYEFSSLPVYLGMGGDGNGLVSGSLIMGIMGQDPDAYMELVRSAVDEEMKEEVEFGDEGTESRSCRRIIPRNVEPERIIDYICRRMDISREKIHVKRSRDAMEAKALMVVLMRCLCGFRCRDICSILGGITQSTASRYCMAGRRLMDEERYKGIVGEFLQAYST